MVVTFNFYFTLVPEKPTFKTMKKKIIAFVFGVAVCGSAAFAQESGFGAKLGLNLANVALGGDGAEFFDDPSMRTSFHIGAYYRYMLNDKIAITPELVYSAQGAKFPATEEIIGYDPFTGAAITFDVPESTWRLNYLNIPIIGHYYINESFDVHLGIQLGLNVGATAEVDGETDDIEDVNGMDFALPIGAGYTLENGLGFNARYNLGLANVYTGEGDFTLKNNVIQISVNYNF